MLWVFYILWVHKVGHHEETRERGDGEMLVVAGTSREAPGTRYQQLTYSAKGWCKQA
jgi:hypothetical protein